MAGQSGGSVVGLVESNQRFCSGVGGCSRPLGTTREKIAGETCLGFRRMSLSLSIYPSISSHAPFPSKSPRSAFSTHNTYLTLLVLNARYTT